MDVEHDAAYRQGPRDQGRHCKGPGTGHSQPRDEEKPVRTEQQQEAQVAPTVAPGAQVGRPAASVGRQGRRNLGDLQAPEDRLHDHLARELHPGRAQVKACDGGLRQSAQPAMEIANTAAEEQPAEETQHRIAKVAVQERHRARGDAAREAVAHHQVASFAQLGDEGVQRREIVAPVRITHDDVAALRRTNPAFERAAIARRGNCNHPRSMGLGDRGRPVGAPVVGDKHLPFDTAPRQVVLRLAHAVGKRLRLVEARHQDREFEARHGKQRPSGLQLAKFRDRLVDALDGNDVQPGNFPLRQVCLGHDGAGEAQLCRLP